MCGPRSSTSFETTLIDKSAGFAALAVKGRGARALFGKEAGGHRWQRIPPSEKRGRVHTSTITVAVLEPVCATRVKLDQRDVDIKTTLGTGPGGQHRNKTESCVIATHRPTGLTVRVDMRSQHQSLSMALEILGAKLVALEEDARASSRNAARRAQVGSGMRGDKIRTYRAQDDRVTDHRTNATFRLSLWVRGRWSDVTAR
jgi:peptide chain release factor 1